MFEIIPNWHPIFVHFTVALFTVATALYLASQLLSDITLKEQWATVARWNLWIGMGLTVITVLSGVYAYNTVAHDAPSHLAMTDHRNWAIATAALFASATLWSIFIYRSGKGVSSMFLLLLLIASLSLASTAWRGGEVVYRYGLGVMSLPNTGQHAHGSEIEEDDHMQAAEESEHSHTGAETEGHHSESGVEGAVVPTDDESGMDAPTMVKQESSESGHHDSTPHTH